MRLDSSLNIALNEQGCLRYPGPKTGYRHLLGLSMRISSFCVVFCIQLASRNHNRANRGVGGLASPPARLACQLEAVGARPGR